MKAMILAAGRGQRLRPLTDEIPKPLVHIGEHRLIEHHLLALSKANICEIVINVHYLAKQIIDILGDGSNYGVHITYSWEQEEALDVGGGIYRALPLLGHEPFIVISADIWTDFSFQHLPNHLTGLAHFVMVPNPPHHPNGDFCLIDHKVKMTGGEKYNYGGISILHPKLFANQTSTRFPITPLFEQAIRADQVSGEFYDGKWVNITTNKELELARSLVTPFSNSTL